MLNQLVSPSNLQSYSKEFVRCSQRIVDTSFNTIQTRLQNWLADNTSTEIKSAGRVILLSAVTKKKRGPTATGYEYLEQSRDLTALKLSS